ncbi:MAG TPA: ATP synthase subunit I [Chloroflexota bacterium]|jgi:hypothetical protein
MPIKPLVRQIALFAAAIGLPVAGLLLLFGYQQAAMGLLLGIIVGTVNQAMIAFRVARIGQLGGRRRTILFIQTGTALRYVMIGAAAAIVLRQPANFDFLSLVLGIVLTMVVGAVAGIRMVLR